MYHYLSSCAISVYVSSSVISSFWFTLDRVGFSVSSSITSTFCFIRIHLGCLFHSLFLDLLFRPRSSRFSDSSAIMSVFLFRPGRWQRRRVYGKVRGSLQGVGALFSSDSSPHAKAEVPRTRHRRTGVHLRGKDECHDWVAVFWTKIFLTVLGVVGMSDKKIFCHHHQFHIKTI